MVRKKIVKPGIHVGTSGWHYAHWRGTFYPEKLSTTKWLDYYLERFGSVELNNSFYRLPSAETFAAWAARVPKPFVFAVKASRFITHMKKLNLDRAGLEKFFSAVAGLGSHLGPILFQLPPHWKLNLERLEHFLNELPPEHRYAFELRDPSWLVPEVMALFESHKIAFCIYELAGFTTPLHVTADLVYVRLHGPGDKYAGDYDRASLERWAQRGLAWQAEGREVHFYFDNDQRGYAAHNADLLAELVGLRPAAPRAEVEPNHDNSDRRTNWAGT